MAHRNCGHGRHNDGDSGMGCLVLIILGLFAMPLVGLWMLFGKNEDQQAFGLVLLIVGLIIWIMIAAQG